MKKKRYELNLWLSLTKNTQTSWLLCNVVLLNVSPHSMVPLTVIHITAALTCRGESVSSYFICWYLQPLIWCMCHYDDLRM